MQQKLLIQPQVLGRCRQTGFEVFAALGECGQGTMAFHHMAPVVLTRVLHPQQHLADLTQCGQGLHGLHGQRSHAKHHQAFRHALRTLLRQALRELLDKRIVHLGARSKGAGLRVLCQIGQHIAPQNGLPALFWRQHIVLVLRPLGQPIGAVVLVAVKHVSHLLGELEQASGLRLALFALDITM